MKMGISVPVFFMGRELKHAEIGIDDKNDREAHWQRWRDRNRERKAGKAP